MDTKNAKGHVTLVASLHIGFGALTVLAAIIVFLIFNFADGFVEDIDEIGHTILKFLGTLLPMVILFFGGIDILAGVALFSYKKWSRVLVLVISAINCLNIPIGTAKGIYSIWALMQPEVMEMFE